jgi:hypothetical protein
MKRLFESIRAWSTIGRILVIIYVILVLCAGFLAIPGPASGLHYTASRYLGPNTRLSDALLVTPAVRTLEDRLRVGREHARLVGSYVKNEVNRGAEVNTENTQPWPSLTNQEIASVELPTEPDWLLFNRGSLVEVWVGTAQVAQSAFILAIVPLDQSPPAAQTSASIQTTTSAQNSAPGRKWLVLLRRSDLGVSGLGSPKEEIKLRIRRLPDAASALLSVQNHLVRIL